MTQSLNLLLTGLVFVGILFMLHVGTAPSVGGTTSNVPTVTPYTLSQFTFFSATTTSATSTDLGGYLSVAGVKKVTLYFTHGGVATTSTGGAVFKVETSSDGSNWNVFNKLIASDLSSTATSAVTIQGATSTAVISVDLSDDTFFGIRCISTEMNTPLGLDGEQTCKASAEY